jgi:hypothetical protein
VTVLLGEGKIQPGGSEQQEVEIEAEDDDAELEQEGAGGKKKKKKVVQKVICRLCRSEAISADPASWWTDVHNHFLDEHPEIFEDKFYPCFLCNERCAWGIKHECEGMK